MHKLAWAMDHAERPCVARADPGQDSTPVQGTFDAEVRKLGPPASSRVSPCRAAMNVASPTDPLTSVNSVPSELSVLSTSRGSARIPAGTERGLLYRTHNRLRI